MNTAASLQSLSRYFAQVAYVVADLDAAVTAMSATFGVPFGFSEGKGLSSEVRFRGQPHAVQSRLAFADLHGVEIEVIQPLSAQNIYTEFLERHGPGLHHAGFKVPDHETFRSCCDQISSSSGPAILEGHIDRDVHVEFCYFDCAAFGASLIEVTHFFA